VIVVIGCGRVGLPLCLFLAGRGMRVTGVDTDLARIEAIRNGKMPFKENGADRSLEKALSSGLFTATDELAVTAGRAEVIIITVGTPLDNDFSPNQNALINVLRQVLAVCRKKTALFLRSTVAPGTSEIVRREIKAAGLNIGRDLYYAYCPERIIEGHALEELGSIPQIVGAFDKKSMSKAAEFFSLLGIDCVVGRPVEAELAKLFNNMYRYVNFALANQCMYMAEKNGAGMKAVLKMCNQGYTRGGPWQPGYAGGPCLFKDGFFLTNQLLYMDLMFASWKINESLSAVLLKEAESLRPLGRVAILGLAFKAGVDDTRNSPGVKLLNILLGRGIDAEAHDPLVCRPGCSDSLQQVLSGATEIFVMVPHEEYKRMSLENLKKLAGPRPIIVDPWYLWGDRMITELGPNRV